MLHQSGAHTFKAWKWEYYGLRVEDSDSNWSWSSGESLGISSLSFFLKLLTKDSFLLHVDRQKKSNLIMSRGSINFSPCHHSPDCLFFFLALSVAGPMFCHRLGYHPEIVMIDGKSLTLPPFWATRLRSAEGELIAGLATSILVIARKAIRQKKGEMATFSRKIDIWENYDFSIETESSIL